MSRVFGILFITLFYLRDNGAVTSLKSKSNGRIFFIIISQD